MFDQPPPGFKPENQSPSQPPAPTPPPSPFGGRPIPTTEPVDMLSGVEPAHELPKPAPSAPTPLSPVSPNLPPTSPLAPPIPSAPAGPIPVILPQEILSDKREVPWKQIIISVLVVVILGAGAWAAYAFRGVLFGLTEPLPATPTPASDDTPSLPEPDQLPPQPPPMVLDFDGDGLLDDKETELGTDSKNLDTDGDGLFDGEEVNSYHINPLNPDTDGDGYRDGDEVRAGFNPNGPGKLLNVPPDVPASQ